MYYIVKAAILNYHASTTKLAKHVWSYVGDKIGFQVLARRIRLLWQGSHSRLECLGRVLFVGVAL